MYFVLFLSRQPLILQGTACCFCVKCFQTVMSESLAGCFIMLLEGKSLLSFREKQVYPLLLGGVRLHVWRCGYVYWVMATLLHDMCTHAYREPVLHSLKYWWCILTWPAFPCFCQLSVDLSFTFDDALPCNNPLTSNCLLLTSPCSLILHLLYWSGTWMLACCRLWSFPWYYLCVFYCAHN